MEDDELKLQENPLLVKQETSSIDARKERQIQRAYREREEEKEKPQTSYAIPIMLGLLAFSAIGIWRYSMSAKTTSAPEPVNQTTASRELDHSIPPPPANVAAVQPPRPPDPVAAATVAPPPPQPVTAPVAPVPLKDAIALTTQKNPKSASPNFAGIAVKSRELGELQTRLAALRDRLASAQANVDQLEPQAEKARSILDSAIRRENACSDKLDAEQTESNHQKFKEHRTAVQAKHLSDAKSALIAATCHRETAEADAQSASSALTEAQKKLTSIKYDIRQVEIKIANKEKAIASLQEE